MAVFAVSFRIKEDSTYQKRYDSFVEALRSGGATKYWDETTSFVIVKTDESIDAFCSRIYVKTEFSESKDIFFVLDVDAKSARVRGPIQYPNTLQSLVPFLKKL